MNSVILHHRPSLRAHLPKIYLVASIVRTIYQITAKLSQTLARAGITKVVNDGRLGRRRLVSLRQANSENKSAYDVIR